MDKPTMDAVRNPYAPGAGTPPPELAGRRDVIESAEITVRRVARGRPAQSMILVGLRGVGKTVLLVKIRKIAEEEGYRTIYIEAHEGKSLPELLVPALRQSIIALSQIEGAKDKARRALRIFKSFVNGLRISISDIEIGLTISPETGTADSGDLEVDLPELLCAVGDAARDAHRPIAIFLDEMQYLSEREFSSLIMSIHRINQSSLPVLLVGAGLPQILGLAGNSKSYAERLFSYPQIGALSEPDARAAIINPARMEGVTIESGAVSQILAVTRRYPYFIQQWSYEAWNIARDERILARDVIHAHNNALTTLDESFFKVRFERCTPAEKRYMRALAGLGSGAFRSGDIADVLGVKSTSVAPVRNKLIKKGMIYSPAHGDTEFTVPMFDEYMMRAMADIDLTM